MSKEIKEEVKDLIDYFLPYTQQTDSLDGGLSDDIDAASACALICVRHLIVNTYFRNQDYWINVEAELLSQMKYT